MTDNLLDTLMDFVEETLTKIKEARSETGEYLVTESNESGIRPYPLLNTSKHALTHQDSMRIFTSEEKFRFTKMSYQFIMRFMQLRLVEPIIMENIIHQLLHGGSRFISIEETKWAIINTLTNHLDTKQLAFLELILCRKEDLAVSN